jgi:hypothetical protein
VGLTANNDLRLAADTLARSASRSIGICNQLPERSRFAAIPSASQTVQSSDSYFLSPTAPADASKT